MNKKFLALVIISLIIFLGWIAADFYFNNQKIEVPAVSESVLNPVDPDLDDSYLSDLEPRQVNRVGDELEF